MAFPRTLSGPLPERLSRGLLGVFVLLGLLSGGYVYRSVRTFVAESQLPIFPAAASDARALPPADPALAALVVPTPVGASVPTAAATPPSGAEPDAEPGVVPVSTVAPSTDGVVEALPPAAAERLTVLVMGIDRREGEEGPWRTDTMILISVDPQSRSVAMLSFPRDLYVTLPDYGYGEGLDRINKANFLGDSEAYPGGGPALAKQTIRRNFGIEVDRYLIMDFDGFRQIVDEIGGIEVDVPERIIDSQYPTEDFGYQTIRFEPGLQHMDGERALIYSRTRKTTSDFARAARQQQVILAVRDKVLSLDIIPSLTPARLGRLATTVNDSIQTDMTIDEMLALAQVARDIDARNIRRAVIDETLTDGYINEYGAEVLLPYWDEILPLVRQTMGVELLAIAPTPVLPEPSYAPPETPTPSTSVASNARLMELARPTHPLFRDLLLQAPGTYNHSIIVSNLAESAAQAIGADMLLVRIAAYYHDVGKVPNPHYFVENQPSGMNLHAVLDDPYRSAEIILHHVPAGLQLSQRYHLPPLIGDMIAQHHGTTVVAWFYHQACERYGEANVDADRFRYAGPKPQTREAAILMLADAVEATVRAVKPSGDAELDALVRKSIAGRLEEGQLDECALTLRDLEAIRRAFVTILQGIYHPRIPYPDTLPTPAATLPAPAPALETPTHERLDSAPAPDQPALGSPS